MTTKQFLLFLEVGGFSKQKDISVSQKKTTQKNNPLESQIVKALREKVVDFDSQGYSINNDRRSAETPLPAHGLAQAKSLAMEVCTGVLLEIFSNDLRKI